MLPQLRVRPLIEITSEPCVREAALGGDGTLSAPFFGWKNRIDWRPDIDYKFGGGFYQLDSSPAGWSQSRMRLIGNGAVLNFTSPGPALHIQGQPLSPLFDVTVRGLIVRGNAATTTGILASACSQSKFEDLRAVDCTFAAFVQEWGVGNTWDSIRHSDNDRPAVGGVGVTPQYGVVVKSLGGSQSTASVFLRPALDTVTVSGFDISNSGTIRIVGGYAEFMPRAAQFASTAQDCTIIGLHTEGISGADAYLLDGGRCDLITCVSTNKRLRVGPTAAHCGVYGGTFYEVFVEATALNTRLNGVTTMVGAPVGMADNSASTQVLGCHSWLGARYPNKLPGGLSNLALTAATGVGGPGELVLGSTIAGTPTGTIAGSMKVTYNGTAYYIPMYPGVTA